MKPPPPPKPTEKLPITHHLTIVQANREEWSVVAMKMQGDEVRRRLVLRTFLNVQDALDELNHAATRIFYFEEPEQVFGVES